MDLCNYRKRLGGLFGVIEDTYLHKHISVEELKKEAEITLAYVQLCNEDCYQELKERYFSAIDTESKKAKLFEDLSNMMPVFENRLYNADYGAMAAVYEMMRLNRPIDLNNLDQLIGYFKQTALFGVTKVRSTTREALDKAVKFLSEIKECYGNNGNVSGYD